MQHALNKQPQTQSCLMFFFISKFAHVNEKSDLYLRKIQICKDICDSLVRNICQYFM